VADFASEIKFLVDAADAARVRDWTRQTLAPDPHGGGPWGDQYCITTLYFDTPAFDVYHRVGSHARSKYRIRRYGAEDTAYLERKMRRGSRLAKRRSAVPLTVIGRLEDGWFARRLVLRQLQPACQIAYLRTARGTAAGRITVDEQLTAAPLDRLAFAGAPGRPLLESRAVVEMKFQGTPPAIFRQLVEELGLGLPGTSKYRLAVEALGLATRVHA
jgi:hypothetical protein